MTAPSTMDAPARLLDRHCQELVEDELTRLARRVPSLAEDHLGAVETALRQIIDRLLPVRRRAEARPETVAALFDLEASY
ncbi:hypothetical protein [Actinoallomurus sp. NPDC052274]|uniref:hypothetical protein n=1 Tax=Actinoallomurus sp. NPDC052274 TaxID=3155420 RepID=UPI00344529F0